MKYFVFSTPSGLSLLRKYVIIQYLGVIFRFYKPYLLLLILYRVVQVSHKKAFMKGIFWGRTDEFLWFLLFRSQFFIDSKEIVHKDGFGEVLSLI